MDNHGTWPVRHPLPGPGILLLNSNRWPLGARLASGFLELGCRVGAVCPVPGHPISKVRGPKSLYRYDGRHPLESMSAAIESFEPDIIVPLCDRSVQHLHELHARCNSESEFDRRTEKLIERSLGKVTSYPVVSSRHDLLMLAKDEDIRVPETVKVDSVEDLKKWENRLPWLLKANGTWGGRGVRRVETIDCAEEALRELTSRISAFRLVKQLVLNRDRDWAISNLHGSRPGIIAQAIVPGRPANCAVACWEGEVLAGIAVEVVQADGPWHPAIVVQVVEGREMLDAAKCIARRLQLTGFFGLDFMIEDGTGDLYLIEMNPRCTPPSSLNLGEGRDLLAAFWAQLAKQRTPRRQAITQKARIAYFPQATLRGADATGASQLDSAYLDIPNDEPELVQELLHPWSERSLVGKLLDCFRQKFSVKQDFPPYVFKVAQSEDNGRASQRELAQTSELRL